MYASAMELRALSASLGVRLFGGAYARARHREVQRGSIRAGWDAQCGWTWRPRAQLSDMLGRPLKGVIT